MIRAYLSRFSWQSFYQSTVSKPPKKDLWWRIAVVCLCLVPLGLVGGTATTDIALTSVAILFAVHVVHQSDWAWLRILWVRLALVIWVYYIAISFQAIEVDVSLKGAVPFIRFVLFGVACHYWLLSHQAVRAWMLKAIAFTVIFATLDTWFQYFWGVDWLGKQARPGATLWHPVWPWAAGYHIRLNAISGKLKIGGMMITMAFPVVIHWLAQLHQSHRAWRIRWGSWLMAFLTLAIIPLTGERTSTLWMLLGVLLTYLWVPQARRGLWYMLLPVLLSVVMAFHFSPQLQSRMLGSMPKIIMNAGANAIDARHEENNIYSAINRTAINLYKVHPIWGVGLKQFDKACRMAPDAINRVRHYYKDGSCNNSPQNMYLEFLVNTGTVGTVLFLGLMLVWASRIARMRRHLSRAQYSRDDFEKPAHLIIVNQPVLIGVLIALCLRIFPFVTTTSFYFSWGALAFWWFGAWLLAYLDDVSRQDG